MNGCACLHTAARNAFATSRGIRTPRPRRDENPFRAPPSRRLSHATAQRSRRRRAGHAALSAVNRPATRSPASKPHAGEPHMRAVLLVLIGLLVGANAVYFWMSRRTPANGTSDRHHGPGHATDAHRGDIPAPPAATPRRRRGPHRQRRRRPRPDAHGPAAAGPGHQRGATVGHLQRPARRHPHPRGARHHGAGRHAGAGRRRRPAGQAVHQRARRPDRVPVRPDSTYAYYYAHLDRYAPGIAEGQALKRGQVIGYVGSTGNADPAAPHLHFAVFLLGPEKQWWKGDADQPVSAVAVSR